jgi:hypothetical protein
MKFLFNPSFKLGPWHIISLPPRKTFSDSTAGTASRSKVEAAYILSGEMFLHPAIGV